MSSKEFVQSVAVMGADIPRRPCLIFECGYCHAQVAWEFNN
jgi:hypothetical protein